MPAIDEDMTTAKSDRIVENIHQNFFPNYEILNHSMKETIL